MLLLLLLLHLLPARLSSLQRLVLLLERLRGTRAVELLVTP